MPRRRSKVGGARPGAGAKPQRGVAATVTRTIKLTPAEAAAQDLAAKVEGLDWSKWVRAAAELAIARGSTR
jgi:hypothetical protein